jgi:hypothetical protein
LIACSRNSLQELETDSRFSDKCADVWQTYALCSSTYFETQIGIHDHLTRTYDVHNQLWWCCKLYFQSILRNLGTLAASTGTQTCYTTAWGSCQAATSAQPQHHMTLQSSRRLFQSIVVACEQWQQQAGRQAGRQAAHRLQKSVVTVF